MNIIHFAKDSFLLTKNEYDANAVQVTIDSVFDVIDLPIATAIKSISGVTLALRERNLIRNTVYFLQGFQSENIDEDKLLEYKEKLFSDTDYCEKEITRIILLLDNNVETLRAKIIGCLYMNLVNQRISHEEFCDYCDVTQRLFVSDYYALLKGEGIENYKVSRLMGLGLLYIKRPEFYLEKGDLYMEEETFPISPFGKKYKELIEHILLDWKE